MKVGQTLLWLFTAALILTQVYAIFTNPDPSGEFNFGFLVGKMLVIIVIIVLAYFVSKAMNKKVN